MRKVRPRLPRIRRSLKQSSNWWPQINASVYQKLDIWRQKAIFSPHGYLWCTLRNEIEPSKVITPVAHVGQPRFARAKRQHRTFRNVLWARCNKNGIPYRLSFVFGDRKLDKNLVLNIFSFFFLKQQPKHALSPCFTLFKTGRNFYFCFRCKPCKPFQTVCSPTKSILFASHTTRFRKRQRLTIPITPTFNSHHQRRPPLKLSIW